MRTAMDKRLLDILCCPATKVPVRLLARNELDVLNTAITAGGVQTTASVAVSAPVLAGLITSDGKLIYRIEDEIPLMLADEAIATTRIEGFPLQR
jgi:uncharacterized protein YbaR (Trm112 family)